MIRHWTAEEVASLNQMRSRGATFKEIARELGKSRSAVGGRVSRQRLPKCREHRPGSGAPTLPPEEARRRLHIAQQVVAEGGKCAAFASRICLTYAGARRFLVGHAPELLSGMNSGRDGREMEPSAALDRLLSVRDGRARRASDRDIAAALGISSPGLCQFLRRWAPDGLDAAIADLMPDEAEAA